MPNKPTLLQNCTFVPVGVTIKHQPEQMRPRGRRPLDPVLMPVQGLTLPRLIAKLMCNYLVVQYNNNKAF